MRYATKTVCLLFFLSVQAIIYANQGESLNKRKVQAIDSLNALADQYRLVRKIPLAQSLLQSAINDSKEIGYKRGEGEAYTIMGNISYAIRNFQDAEKYGKRAVDIFSYTNPDTLLAKAWVTWANAVWAQSKFEEAISGFEKAQTIFDHAGDSSGVGNTYSLLAMAEEERGNYEKAFQYSTQAVRYKEQSAWLPIGKLYADVGDYDMALEYYSKISDNDLKLTSSLNVGEAYFLKKIYASALFYYRHYLSTLDPTDTNALSKPYFLLGELYRDIGKYDSSLYYLPIALHGFRKVNDRNWLMRSLLELGKVSKDIGQPKQAIAYSRELLDFAEHSGARQYSRDAHYLLYELFESLHMTDSAYSHLREYSTLNNAIDIEVSAQKLAFFKASAPLEQAVLKIDLLNKQKQLQQEEIKQSARQKLLLFIGLLVLIVLSIIVGRNFYLKKRNADHLLLLSENKLEIQSLQHIKKQSELEMQVLRTQMNPHFIFNALNSISRFVLQNKKVDADEYLTKFSRLMRMILQNSQNAVITLESELESLRLYLELEMLRFDHQFCYSIDSEDSVDVSMIKVPPLIIQPFVENAIWHGLMPKKGKGRISIQISTDKQLLFIKIIDDGVGRAVSATTKKHQPTTHQSLGLKTTSQRINMLYSRNPENSPVKFVDLVDTFGKPAGTEVILKLPLRYD
jgi:tetratricopeptide (TPR) repeat protein